MAQHFGTRPDTIVSVVIGSYNRYRFLKAAIESVREELRSADFAAEIIVVDGGSDDGTLKWLLKQKDVITIVQHNRGTWQGKEIERRSWGYFMNLAFKCAQGKYVCMLSDDCLVVPGAIRNGVELFESRLAAGEKVGAVAFYWRNWPEQEKYWVGLTLGQKMTVNHGLYLNRALKEVNYVDEENYFFYYADGDLCLKMWDRGYSVVDSPGSFIEHYSHANMNVRTSNLAREAQDWGNYLHRWSPTYGNPVGDDLGGAIYREHHDPFATAQHFRSADPMRLCVPKILKPFCQRFLHK